MEKLLLYGLAVAFVAFAAKAGFALGLMQVRTILFTAFVYMLTFLALGFLANMEFIRDILNIAKFGVIFHLFVSVGLVIWGICPVKHELAEKVLLFPCPFCLLTIFLSVSLGSKLAGVSPVVFSIKAFLVFILLVGIFTILSRILKLTVEQIMLAAGVYYISLIGCSYYWSEVAKVYALAQKSIINYPSSTFGVSVFIFIVLITGFVKGVKVG